MYEAVKYLYTLGHTNIAYIGDFSPIDPMQMEKYKGFNQSNEGYYGLSVDE